VDGNVAEINHPGLFAFQVLLPFQTRSRRNWRFFTWQKAFSLGRRVVITDNARP
jgi:hypothetical protein